MKRRGVQVLLTGILLGLGAWRGYREFVPSGAKATAFLFASEPAGRIPGTRLQVHVNDAGAAHSGHHWVWVVRYGFLRGWRVIASGYAADVHGLRTRDADSEGDIEIEFLDSRYGARASWQPVRGD